MKNGTIIDIEMKKIFSLILLFLLCNCKEKQKSCFTNFTFGKANIHISYLLKINSSDTVYYLDRYPYGKKRLYYFVLDKDKRKYLTKLICELNFPKDSVMLNEGINDGTTIAFSLDNKKRVLLHGKEGPQAFWNFAEWIEGMKNYHGLKPVERNIEFDNFESMFSIPPIIK